MRVLALTTWCPYPLVNGSAIRFYHLVRALANRHDVHLMTFSAPAAPSPDDVAHLSSFCRSVTVLPRSPFTPVNGSHGGLWSGTPRTEEQREETNPLGPAQDLTGTVRGEAKGGRTTFGLLDLVL